MRTYVYNSVVEIHVYIYIYIRETERDIETETNKERERERETQRETEKERERCSNYHPGLNLRSEASCPPFALVGDSAFPLLLEPVFGSARSQIKPM